jgi:hypothetical protein
MDTTAPNFETWTSDHVTWLIARLRDLNWSYHDLDTALGFPNSRGSYTYLVCECGRAPSLKYRRRLSRWWVRGPQRKFDPALIERIRAVAVPFLRAREGHPVARCYSRKQARMARRVSHE